MTSEYAVGNGPTNAVISSPSNNATVPPAELVVRGTSPLGAALPIVVSLYQVSQFIGGTTAAINGNQWEATLRGAYAPGTYRLEVFQAAANNITLYMAVTRPIIESPSGEIPEPRFSVEGRWVERGGVIIIYNAADHQPLNNSSSQTGDRWTADITLPSETQPLTFYARQKIGNYYSNNSNQMTVTLLRVAPVIDSPKPGEVVAVGSQLLLRGRGTPGKTIDVMTPGGAILHATAEVKADRTWEAVFNLANYPNGGPVEMTAGHHDMNDWSQPQSFILLARPTITTPGNGAVTDPRGPISGGGGTSGAIVEVLKDLDHSFKVGQGTAGTNGQWSVTTFIQEMLPGSFTIVARQTIQGVISETSLPRAFKVRPPRLSVTATAMPDRTIRFSGAGYNAATVRISKISGPGDLVLPPVEVTNSRWEIIATNMLFGAYRFSAIQDVSDNAEGRIPSQPFEFTFDYKIGLPTEVTYTVENYTLTFRGKGFTGATVVLLNDGGAGDALPQTQVENDTWTSTASTQWGPTKDRNVHIRQGLNGYWDSPEQWHTVKVTIAPLAPVITQIIENGVSPDFSGTCWPNAVVILKFSDNNTTTFPATVNGGNWSFRRPTPFTVDREYTVTATQTFALQTSVAASRNFWVYAPMLRPTISEPAANAEVGRDVTVKGGNGMKGATLEIRDVQYNTLLKSDSLTVDGVWSVPLSGLEFRQYYIAAKQVRGQRPSELSETREFTVVLLAPRILVPAPNGDLPRIGTVSGTGMPGGRVTVYLKGQTAPLLENLEVDAKGDWQGPVALEIGDHELWAIQTFAGQTSRETPRQTFRVVPLVPFIESPADGERTETRMVVSGFGDPGHTVTVAASAAPQTPLGNGVVQEDRTWSLTITLNETGGNQRLVAVQSQGEFKSSAVERAVLLAAYQPQFSEPGEGTWRSHPFELRGVGKNGRGEVVDWFNPESRQVQDFVISASTWQATSGKAMRPGGHWLRFRQSIANDPGGTSVRSQWAETGRVEIQAPEDPSN